MILTQSDLGALHVRIVDIQEKIARTIDVLNISLRDLARLADVLNEAMNDE